MIQLEQQQHGEFVGGGGGVVVADTNYLYPARWGWINEKSATGYASCVMTQARQGIPSCN